MKRRGFTLIELLVVIAIIGILAAAALIALSRSQSKARDATRKQDLFQVRRVLETYQIDNPGTYPDKSGSIVDLSTLATDLTTQLDGSVLPEDPQKASGKTYKYVNLYATATATDWSVAADKKYYTIEAQLEAPKTPPATNKFVWWHVNSQGVPFENPNGLATGAF